MFLEPVFNIENIKKDGNKVSVQSLLPFLGNQTKRKGLRMSERQILVKVEKLRSIVVVNLRACNSVLEFG